MSYSAFISYNQRDKAWARWLHRALESYRLPRAIRGRDSALGPIGTKLPPIFRDRDELGAAVDLGAAVMQALARSATLIVICSPNSVSSRWVNEEIRAFAALGRRNRILTLIVSGDPMSNDPALSCMPPALREDGAPEPLAADARPSGDGRSAARLKLIAGMLAIPFDELRRREQTRRQRWLATVAAGTTAGFTVTSGLAIYAAVSRHQAVIARNDAVAQRDIAEQRTRTAEQTAGFVQSLFAISDPSEAQGDAITARAVLDAGARKIRTTLEDQPAVRADLAATLAETYGALGLPAQDLGLARWTFGLRHGDPDVRFRQLVALARAERRTGNPERAILHARRAVAIGRLRPTLARALPRALVALAESQRDVGDLDGAARLLREAYAIDARHIGRDQTDAAVELEDSADIALARSDLASADRLARAALAIRRRFEGDLSPSVSDDVSLLARIASRRGDDAAAASLLRSRLAMDEKVLGPNHPDVAVTLNDLGRALLNQSRFTQAQPLLDRAVRIDRLTYGNKGPQIGAALLNTGLVQVGRGQDIAAAASFAKAAAAVGAEPSPIAAIAATEAAAIDCAQGRSAAGLARLNTARSMTATIYAGEPWRVAWVDVTRSYCLRQGARENESAFLARRALPIVLARWKPGSFFAIEARLRSGLVQR